MTLDKWISKNASKLSADIKAHIEKTTSLVSEEDVSLHRLIMISILIWNSQQNDPMNTDYLGLKFDALKRVEELKSELKISDKLLIERDKLLAEIPQCPEHGACIPHAREWIRQMKSIAGNVVPNTKQPAVRAKSNLEHGKDYIQEAIDRYDELSKSKIIEMLNDGLKFIGSTSCEHVWIFGTVCPEFCMKCGAWRKD